MKTLEKAKQWIGDLLYENGVHQRDRHIFDKAENELEEFFKEVRVDRDKEVVAMIERMKKELPSSGCEICALCVNGDVCLERKQADSHNKVLNEIINNLDQI